jgi:hypothetical protein
LNKGEERNALARAVFFYRLGEIRDRSFEQQRYRASALNLVTPPGRFANAARSAAKQSLISTVSDASCGASASKVKLMHACHACRRRNGQIKAALF